MVGPVLPVNLVTARTTSNMIAVLAAPNRIVLGPAIDHDALAGESCVDLVGAWMVERTSIALDAVVAAAVLGGVAVKDQRCGAVVVDCHRVVVTTAVHSHDRSSLVIGNVDGQSDVECFAAFAEQDLDDFNVACTNAS